MNEVRREARRITKCKRRAVRSCRRMIRYSMKSSYWDNMGRMYGTLAVTNNWQTIDEIVAEFGAQLNSEPDIEGDGD